MKKIVNIAIFLFLCVLLNGQILYKNTNKFQQLKLIADRLNSISNYQAECDLVVGSSSSEKVHTVSTLISLNVPNDTLCGFFYFFKTHEEYRKNGGDFTAFFNNTFYISMRNEISKHNFFDEPRRFQETKFGNGFIPAIHRSTFYLRVIPKELSRVIYKSLLSNEVMISQKPDTIIEGMSCHKYLVKKTNSTLSPYTELCFDRKSLHLIFYKESLGGLTPQYIIAKLSNIKIDQKIASNYFSEEKLFGRKVGTNNKINNSKFKLGQTVPDWELPILGETTYFSSKKVRGKYLLLEFTGTWCHYCRDAVKMMNRIEDEFKGNEKLKILSIYSTDIDNPATISKFARDQKIKSTILHSASSVGDKYEIKAYPSFFIIDPAGKLRLKIEGFNKDVENEIITYFRKNIK